MARNSGHLVRELYSRLHVLQSLVVACSLRVCRGGFPMVLATDPPSANPRAMGDFGADFGGRVGCLLCQHSCSAGALR